MPTDQQVSARMILEARLELERRGSNYFMEHLEKTEPDLANFVMETLSVIYQRMTRLGGPPIKTQRLFRQVKALLIISIESMRKGHLELWKTQMGSQLPLLDPADEDPPLPHNGHEPDIGE